MWNRKGVRGVSYDLDGSSVIIVLPTNIRVCLVVVQFILNRSHMNQEYISFCEVRDKKMGLQIL